MSTAETIYELVKALPEDKASMVLKFTEFLRQEMQSSVVSQSPVSKASDFFALYGSCSDDEFDVDDEGIFDETDDELIGVFDE
ncbi:MAG: DUF2281 domain-containing protein [Leptolyngbyaceae bacterium]|nr:DUF2281 domain-containing protein [Leptolyngbyaceae bacterium]